MRTLTAYGIGVIVVLAVLNGIAWKIGTPRLHGLNVFSAASPLGCSGRTFQLGLTATARPPDAN